MRQQVQVPAVFEEKEAANDYILEHYRDLASRASNHCLSANKRKEWKDIAPALRQKVIKEANLSFFKTLDFDVKETAKIERSTFHIKNIAFQTRPSVYATANLYLPKIEGRLPAILVAHGHWAGARNAGLFRQVALGLVNAGYIVLTMDAWGAGERGSVAHQEEYHGGNLGASLFNIGETLMGMQLTDNVRALDFLCSLPMVDTQRIGVTGASGGGNQAMWLAALDERIKAVVPVVSVGTFESYVMNSNCVCELLPNGLTFLEESHALGLIAPRALKVLSALREDNPSFYHSQMLHCYKYAEAIYAKLGAKEKLAYELFDQEHTYSVEMLRAAVDWFDLHLTNSRKQVHRMEDAISKEIDQEVLITYHHARPVFVETTEHFCRERGSILHSKSLLDEASIPDKLKELEDVLGHIEDKKLRQIIKKGKEGLWQKVVLECTNNQKIPLLLYEPAKGRTTSCKVFFHGEGKEAIPLQLLEQAFEEGSTLLLVDLWGLGEQGSPAALKLDEHLPPFHTLARSALWLGRTVLGEWFSDIQVVYRWLIDQQFGSLTFVCFKEPSVAALLFSTMHNLKSLVLYDSPYSYIFDSREGVDYYNMSIHLPGVLYWGDIMTMAGLSKAEAIQFVRARSMSGRLIDLETKQQLEKEIAVLKARWDQEHNINFIIN